MGGSCLLAAHVPNRLVPLPASPCVPPDGAGGCVARACLLPYSHAVGLCGSPPLLAWRGVVASDEKKRAGVFVFPVRLFLCLYDVVFALVVVVHEALLIDDVAILSAWMDMRARVAWLELLAHAGTVCSAFDIQDGVLGVFVRGNIDVLGEGFVEGKEYGLAVKAFPVERIDIVMNEFGHECDGGGCGLCALLHAVFDGGSVFDFGLCLTAEEFVCLLCGVGGCLIIAHECIPYG